MLCPTATAGDAEPEEGRDTVSTGADVRTTVVSQAPRMSNQQPAESPASITGRAGGKHRSWVGARLRGVHM